MSDPQCPHVVQHGLSAYCSLAESGMRKLMEENRRLRSVLSEIREDALTFSKLLESERARVNEALKEIENE